MSNFEDYDLRGRDGSGRRRPANRPAGRPAGSRPAGADHLADHQEAIIHREDL